MAQRSLGSGSLTTGLPRPPKMRELSSRELTGGASVRTPGVSLASPPQVRITDRATLLCRGLQAGSQARVWHRIARHHSMCILCKC